jgi:O-antigen ligase
MRPNGITNTRLSLPSYPGAIAGLAILGLAPLLGWALAYESWFICGGLVLLALLPLIVRWPMVTTFGVYAFLAVSLDSLPFLPGGATLTKPVGVLTGAVLLSVGLIERRLGHLSWAAVWWSLFMLWSALSAGWAGDSTLVFRRLPTVISLVIMYAVAASFRPSRRELYWVCALTVLGGVFAASLAYWFGSDVSTAGEVGRTRLVVGGVDDVNPNTLGRLLLLPLAFAIAGVVGSRGALRRLVAMGCVGLIGFGILISVSRGAVVAAVAMLLVLLYRLRVRWQIVAVMILLLAIVTAMPDVFYERFGALASGEDTSGSNRTDIWRAGLQIFVDRSGFTGVGLDNSSDLSMPSKPRSVPLHNIYLAVLADLGMIGLALMLAAISSHFLAARNAAREGPGSIILAASEAAFVGMLICAFFADYLWTKTFWLALTILTWAVSIEKPREAPDEDTDAPRLHERLSESRL